MAIFKSVSLLQHLEREQEKRNERERPAANGEQHLVALIEDVRSLFNVGSMFRTADGAGFEHLYLCGITGCPPRKEIAKTSLGAEDSVGWEYHVESLDILPKLREQGYLILALERTTGSIALPQALSNGLNLPICLLLGNEVTGVSPQALEQADLVCHLAMRGVKESLNVAVAFGIAAYAIADRFLAESL